MMEATNNGVNVPVYAAAQRKEKADIDNTTLTHLIDNTTWWNPDNFTVEGNE
jgi:hypothetical protein